MYFAKSWACAAVRLERCGGWLGIEGGVDCVVR
jgi:hypothetical protein